jgi:hypothetical protein
MKIYNLKAQEFRDWLDPVKREAICKRLLDEFGDTLIRRAGTGQTLRVVRREPLVAFAARDTPIAPHPDNCTCTQYAGRPPGEHHPACIHREQWLRQVAAGHPSAGQVAPAVSATPAAPAALEVEVVQQVPLSNEQAPSLGQVGLPGPISNEPITVDVGGVPVASIPWLISPDGTRMRPALVNEIEEARFRQQEEGVAAVDIDGVTYSVQ